MLCTIQKKQRCDDVEDGKKKKKEEGQKGIPAGGNGEEGSPARVNGEEGSSAGPAGGKKRKIKEKVKAQNGTVHGRQLDHPVKRSTVPMPPKKLSQSPPGGGNYKIPPNMHMVHQCSGCPIQRSPAPSPPQEILHPEMMVPPVGDSYNFDPNTAMHQYSNHPMSRSPVPAPPQELPHAKMVAPLGGDSHNTAPIMGMSSGMTWAFNGSSSYGTDASMTMGNFYGHPFLKRNSYEEESYTQHVQHSTVAPPGVYNHSGVARNTMGHSSYGYASSAFGNLLHFPPLPSYAAGAASTSTQGMFMGNGVVSNNHMGFPASQHHGGRMITGGVHAPAS